MSPSLADRIWGKYPSSRETLPVSNMLRAILVPGGLVKQLIYDNEKDSLVSEVPDEPAIPRKLYYPIVTFFELTTTGLEAMLVYYTVNSIL